jgi:hypothetical protein
MGKYPRQERVAPEMLEYAYIYMRRKKIVLFLDYGVMVEMLGYVYIYM